MPEVSSFFINIEYFVKYFFDLGYKKARGEIKKRSIDSGRLQKKVRKGQNSMQRMLESAVQEVNDHYFVLLETERQAVRQALTEQRSQFCIFVSWFKPVMVSEKLLFRTILTNFYAFLFAGRRIIAFERDCTIARSGGFALQAFR